MDSKTKTTLTTEQITALVKNQFGSGTRVREIVPLTAGMFNTAYGISFENLKPTVVMRIAPHPKQPVLSYEKDLMRREKLILETVQDEPDLPVPKLLGFDFSRQNLARDFMFVEMLSGDNMHALQGKISPENWAELEFQLGRFVARIGQIKGQHFGYFAGGLAAGSTSWRQAFVTFLEAILDDGETLGAKLPIPYTEVRTLIHQNSAPLDKITQPVLVHWDLWAGNVFVKPENGKYVIEGLIDWERAFWGDPEAETPLAGQFYSDAFYEGYGKPLATVGPEAVRQSLYRLYLWLVLLVEIKVRDYSPDYLPWARESFEKEIAFLRN
jgi:aminoglycoside phosphotransferase (APT) family kinase protein